MVCSLRSLALKSCRNLLTSRTGHELLGRGHFLAKRPFTCKPKPSNQSAGRRVAFKAILEPSGILEGHGQERPQSAYLHLPFCKRRCFYCDFPMQAVGSDPSAPQVQNTMQQYVDTLCQEIEATDTSDTDGLKTLFFGGGTPSLIPPSMLACILDCLHRKMRFDADIEISMEADPGTFTFESLQQYMSLGVNRFSIGVQAFQQDVLDHCGRSHGLSDVYQAIEDVHRAGVKNWSLDLISGLPYTSLDAWGYSLQEALKADSPHISVYDLQVEDKTKFGKLYSAGQFPLPDDENTASMFCMASEVLRDGGLEHYEISSYAKPGHRCKHNQVYWGGAPYHAFGLGAASYIKHQRFSRPRSMASYRQWVSQLDFAGSPMRGQGASNAAPEEDRLLDMVMLRLRLADGLDLKRLEAEYGAQSANLVMEALQPHIKRSLVHVNGNRVSLKDPEGYLVSNDIISDIFAALNSD